MYNKNKKGISPLIATVLIIGFTIVLAALVITWGTNLFKTTVSQTETTSKFSLACTSNLNLEIQNKVVTAAANQVNVTMRNNNQDKAVDSFQFILYDTAGKVKQYSTFGNMNTAGTINSTSKSLTFPVPQMYTVTIAAGDVNLASLSKIEVYPVFTIDGTTKACSSPQTVTF